MQKKLIIYTKRGNRTELRDLFPDSEGLWCFEYYGDTSFVDPHDSSVWEWVGYDNGVDEVLVVIYNGIFFIRTISRADCLAQELSFYWDDTNGILYLHWYNFGDDYYFDRALSNASEVIPGFANGYGKNTNNVFDGVFYRPDIVGLGGFSKKADLIKLGLVTFEDSNFALTDQANERFKESALDTVGLPLWVYLVTEDDIELTDDKRVFTGIYNGYEHGRDSIGYNIIEQRLFDNKPVCPNVINSTDFPNVGDLEGEFIPVAFGQIRRGIMLLTNKDSLTSGASGTATFLVSDPALGAVLAISNVYDAAGEVQTITATNLTACTVDVTKPAGVSPGDLKEWTWGGQGYYIDGTYNNGLDIIRAAYNLFANVQYLVSTFDTTKWATETTNNPQAVGLSISSEKGFVEEIIEPITTSLQGIVETTGDGRITWSSRDLTAKPTLTIPTIKAQYQDELPGVNLDSQDTVSEIQVLYSPNFKADDFLSYLYDAQKTEVVVNYLINKREPISPLKTVLVNESDAQALAIEIMETSAAPIRKIVVNTTELLTDLRFFDIIGIDTGTFNNVNIEYGEVLGISPNYDEFTQTIEVRIVPGYPEEPPYYNSIDDNEDFQIKDNNNEPILSCEPLLKQYDNLQDESGNNIVSYASEQITGRVI